SIGTLLGGFLLGLWGGTKNKMQTMMPALTIIGAVLVGIGLLPANGFILFVVLAVITGLAAPFFSSLFMSLIQEKIKPEFLGRVLGVTSSMMALACPIGLSLSGAFAEKIGVNNWVVLSGVLTLLCVLLCLSNKNVREVDSSLTK
ncbi:MAG TPA: MFS transporter, partial [Pelotomaculum sp.]|nr:MFS transporter [Pelotomaculum sp.]